MVVEPSATYEASIDWGVSGATIGMRVIDNAGATTVARVTGFTEYPAGSGVYYRGSNTAPASAGQYTLLFDDDGGTAAVGHVATEELVVSSTASAATVGTSNLYVSRAELKATLQISSSSQDDDIDLAISAASRVIDKHKRTRFYPATETRYYHPQAWDRSVMVDDLNTAGTVAVDTAGAYTYATTWTEGTHFVLEPANASLDGEPYNELVLLPQSGARFPGYLRGLRITGSFGWSATPIQVKQACSILAARYYNRRNSPLGVIAVGIDSSAMRLAWTDPDVFQILKAVGGREPVLLA